MRSESIARICHEVNRAYCESLGDTSNKVWEDAPEWQRLSAIGGVKEHLRNPDMTPEQSHAAWLKVKQEAGWTYGPIKDEVAKTHPCMVPFDQLPQEQKAKDFLFRAVVHAVNKWPRG